MLRRLRTMTLRSVLAAVFALGWLAYVEFAIDGSAPKSTAVETAQD